MKKELKIHHMKTWTLHILNGALKFPQTASE